MRKISVRWILVIILLMATAWVFFRIQVANSDAVTFVGDKIKHSASVQSKIGNVADVYLGFFGRYHASYSVSQTEVEMDVKAVGEKGRLVIYVEMTKDDGGRWTIDKAVTDGQSIQIE